MRKRGITRESSPRHRSRDTNREIKVSLFSNILTQGVAQAGEEEQGQHQAVPPGSTRGDEGLFVSTKQLRVSSALGLGAAGDRSYPSSPWSCRWAHPGAFCSSVPSTSKRGTVERRERELGIDQTASPLVQPDPLQPMLSCEQSLLE